MFKVELRGETLVCTQKLPGSTDKIVSMGELICEVKIPLGIKPNSNAAKAIKTEFEKRLNAKSKTLSGSFINYVAKKRTGIGKFVEQHGFDEKNKPSILKEAEADLKTLWDKYCNVTAPKIAHEALQETAKTVKADTGLKGGKWKAQGKSLAGPALTIAAGVAGVATGGGMIAGAAAVLKIVSGAMKGAERYDAIAQRYKSDSDALLQDLGAVSTALKSVAQRIQRLEAIKKGLNTQIAALTAENSRIEAAAKKLSASGGAKTAEPIKRLRAQIQKNASAIEELKRQIFDASGLTEHLKAMAVTQNKMAQLARAEGKVADKAAGNSRDLVDGIKDALTIIDKID